MMKKIILIAVVLVLSACSEGIRRGSWYVADYTDQFNGKSACRASIAREDVGEMHYTFGGDLYPFLERVDDEVFFGVTSVPLTGKNVTTFVPSFPMPIGDIEVKIDNHAPVLIAAAETPIKSRPGSSDAIAKDQMEKALMEIKKDNDKVVTSINKTTESLQKTMLPYIKVGGEKYSNLINQMKTGNKIIFRQTSIYSNARIWEYALTNINEQIARCNL